LFWRGRVLKRELGDVEVDRPKAELRSADSRGQLSPQKTIRPKKPFTKKTIHQIVPLPGNDKYRRPAYNLFQESLRRNLPPCSLPSWREGQHGLIDPQIDQLLIDMDGRVTVNNCRCEIVGYAWP